MTNEDEDKIEESGHWLYSTVECLLCGNEHYSVFYMDYFDDNYPILECDNCGNITEHEIIGNKNLNNE